jgi:tetratricopeptide (TPR) repeat protein
VAVLDTSPPLVWSGATLAVSTAACIVGLLAFWLVLKPLRASYDIRGAALALSRGEGNLALERYNAATRLAPYEGSYWLQRGKFFEQVKRPEQAATSYAKGVQHDPRSWDVLVAGATLAKAQGDTATLVRYARALDALDPAGTWHKRVDG